MSGASGLVLEILWCRELALVFGSAAIAVSVVASVFMAGLAAGSALAPGLVRGRNPFLCYAACEAAVGAWALIAPPLFKLFPVITALIFNGASPGLVPLIAARALLSSVALLVPAAAMGASLPILATGLDRGRPAGSGAGRLYALNTFGAVAGAALAGFCLIPALGMSRTGRVAALTGFAIAAVISAATLYTGAGRVRKAGGPAGAPIGAPLGRPPKTRVLAAAFFAGFLALALEVVWTRALAVVIGSSAYSFTIILSSVLLGIAAGAALSAAWLEKERNLFAALYAVLAGTGILAFAASAFIDRLPGLLGVLYAGSALTLGRVVAYNYATAWIVVLLPSAGMGALFPILVQMASGGGEGAGRSAARVYTHATAGNVAGGIAAGLFMAPAIGVRTSLSVLCAGYLALAAIVAAGSGSRLSAATEEWPGGERLHPGKKKAFAFAGATAAVLAGAAIATAMPRWDTAEWVSGIFRVYLARGEYAGKAAGAPEILFHRDGVSSSVTVERRGGGLSLKVNGKVDASNGTDMHTQILSGLWPILLHRNPKTAAMVGYGSGVTAGAMLSYPLERLTAIELEPAVYDAARLFDPYNGRPWSDPRLETVADDGRNFLSSPGPGYDIIVSEPSNPWMSGASPLFTRDYWEAAASRLNPGGVFAQWLQLYELSESSIKTLIATYCSVFPHVLIVRPRAGSNDTLMLGSMEPLAAEWGTVAARMSLPGVGGELSRAGVRSPADLAALLLSDEAGVRGYAGGARLNTDDNALIEFSSPRDLVAYAISDADEAAGHVPQADLRGLAARVLKNAPPSFGDEVAFSLMRAGRFPEAGRIAFAPSGSPAGGSGAGAVLRLLAGSERAFPYETAGRDATGERWETLVGVLARHDWAGAAKFVSLLPDPPGGADARAFFAGYLLHMARDDEGARSVLEPLASGPAAARYPAVIYFLARTRLSLGDSAGAVDAMRSYVLQAAAATDPSAPEGGGI